ncbi:MAG: hypothetical protein ACRDRI_05650 [Pseudonocardiaceae bacterium]
MITPTTVYMVTTGRYDDYRVLAVFTERHGAQDYADHHNLTTERLTLDDAARVEEIDLYGPGWRRPPTAVIDSDTVTEPRAIRGGTHNG